MSPAISTAETVYLGFVIAAFLAFGITLFAVSTWVKLGP